MQFNQFRLATRGLIVQNKKLLFVSDDNEYWYLPGGRLEPGESLSACLEREVFEETGFIVRAERLLHVLECLDTKDNTHKFHFFFTTTILQANSDPAWEDQGGCVQSQRFFSLMEIQENPKIIPPFLRKGEWLKPVNLESNPVYEGQINTKGFEILTPFE